MLSNSVIVKPSFSKVNNTIFPNGRYSFIYYSMTKLCVFTLSNLGQYYNSMKKAKKSGPVYVSDQIVTIIRNTKKTGKTH